MKFNQPTTILAHSLIMSTQDAINKYTSDEVQEGNQMLNQEGDIFIPLNIRPSITSDTLPSFSLVDDDSKISWDKIRSTCKDAITTIEYNSDAIDIGVFLQQLAQNEGVYGCLLTTEDGFNINPLHPLIAFMYNANIIELPKTGKLHIYEWRNGIQGVNYFKEAIAPETLQSKTDEYFNELVKFLQLTPNIIMSPSIIERSVSVDKDQMLNMIERPQISSVNDVNLKINIREISQSGIQPESLLIPLQKISDGVSTPYYGLVYIEKPTKDNQVGYNISPMMSGNINESYLRSAGSVCTGSENKAARSGWLTLSNVNLNSMFYGNILWKKSTYPYIMACKKFSAEIWGAYSAARNPQISDAD